MPEHDFEFPNPQPGDLVIYGRPIRPSQHVPEGKVLSMGGELYAREEMIDYIARMADPRMRPLDGSNARTVADEVRNGLLDTERAELLARKIPPLVAEEQEIAELLLELGDYGSFELVRFMDRPRLNADGTAAWRCAIDCTTGRGKLRIVRTDEETWRECLVRYGLVDA